MEVDLSGKTVTQALEVVKAYLDAGEVDELLVRTDNEVVKLNLYNRIVKMGHRCKLERKAAFHYLRIKPKPRPAAPVKPIVNPGVTAAASRNPLVKEEINTRDLIQGDFSLSDFDAPQANRAPAPRPSERVAPRPGPAARPQPAAGPTAVKRWLVIQTDQIGQKDTMLGCTLLEEVVTNLDGSELAGVFLTHRGVRLLDVGYQGGRLLRALGALEVPIWACSKSVDFYKLAKLPSSVRVTSLAALQAITGVDRLMWL